MRPKVEIREGGPLSAEQLEASARFRRNAAWLSEHGLSFWENHRGMYITVSEGDVIVSVDAWEGERQAKKRHPDDTPFTQYIPRHRAFRIYAC